MAVNLSLRQIQDSESTIFKNNTAAIVDIQDDMNRYKKSLSGIQQLDHSLANSLANLSTTLQQQVALSTNFSSSLTNTTQQLGALQNDLTRHNRAITSLQQSDSRLANSLGIFNTTMQKQSASTSSFTSFMSMATQKFSELQNLVAFSAHSGSNLNLASYTTIKFEYETLNVGRGYSASSGVFTCPVDGYYVFTWTLQTKENHNLDSRIVKNGRGSDRYINMYAGSSAFAAESNTEIMHLVKGDRVYIEGRGYFCGYIVSSFNGWKIV